MDRLTRNPLLGDLTLEVAVDNTASFMRIVGTPNAYMEQVKTVPIIGYRGMLPCDLDSIIQIRDSKTKIAYRYSTDSFYMGENMNSIDYTYKTQGNIIFVTPIENTEIEVSYTSIPIDEDGYPMIPDLASYQRALELYIKKEYYSILFDIGKIGGQVVAKLDKDYAWAVGQCQNELVMPSIDQMEALSNMWNSPITNNREHDSGFISSGTKKELISH